MFSIKIYQRIVKLFYFLKSRRNWRRIQEKQNIKLEIGSGSKSGINGFITVDTVKGSDLFQDLRKGIPLGDKRVEFIYSSHLLEHMSFHELIKLLKECHRVLQKGGIFSVCVPNARKYIESYIKNETFQLNDLMYQPAVVDTGSFIDQINYIAYMGGEHKYLFDEQNLINILKIAGFDKVELRKFDPSIDLFERDHESIYAIGIK